jgi:hypothetical protein
VTLHALTRFTIECCSGVYSLFSPPLPPAVPAFAEDVVCRCFAPAAEGLVSVDDENGFAFPLPFEVDASGLEEESALSIESSNFSASGVEKSVIDF